MLVEFEKYNDSLALVPDVEMNPILPKMANGKPFDVAHFAGQGADLWCEGGAAATAVAAPPYVGGDAEAATTNIAASAE